MALHSPNDAGAAARSSKPRTSKRRLFVERLESRLLMAVDPFANLLSHGGICSCPICSGKGLETITPEPATVVGSSGSLAASSVAGLPQLSSRPGAAATLFLDFDGHTEAAWGEYTNVVTRVFDRDGDESSFSASEVSSIHEIWSRVAEDYAPYNINVTTVAPPLIANRVATRIAIGGDWRDWFGQSAGGVAYVGGFYNGASNVGYVFEDALGNGNPRYVAEAASHEAGHTFGLLHQATWSGGTLEAEYNRGNTQWAPIMGVGYYSARTTWHNGPTSSGPYAYQDDMTLLANSSNGFGYVADDYGNTQATATMLSISNNSVSLAGLIGGNTDRDMFRFDTSGGSISFTLGVAQFGANLDGVLELLNTAGQSILVANPTTSLSATLSTTLLAGTYFLQARSSGGYGNVGAYTLTGTVPGATQTPEISVDVGGTNVADGGTLNFGSTTVGSAVTRTITVRNSGGGTLSVGQVSGLPAGFTLVSNIPAGTQLTPGQAASFTVRLDAAAAGNFGGAISFTNGDSDEGPFNITLSGAVTATAAAPLVRIIDNGAAGFSTTGTWYRQTYLGRESDIHYALRGNGSATASWTFSGLEAGQYRVSATWPGSIIYATNAPFTVVSGSQTLGTVAVNQERASSTFLDAGSRWQNLGTFTITGNQLVVRLTNAANDRVVADAIRIERVYSTSAGVSSRGLTLDDAAALFAPAGEQGSAAITATISPATSLASTLRERRDSLTAGLSGGLPATGLASSHELIFSSYGDIEPELEVLDEAISLLEDLRGAL